MKLLVRLLVAVVVAVGLAGPVGPAAAASTGAAGSGDPPFSALVFSKTAAFRHASIPAGVAAIQQLGAQHNSRSTRPRTPRRSPTRTSPGTTW